MEPEEDITVLQNKKRSRKDDKKKKQKKSESGRIGVSKIDRL
jgi:hypothetical protein